MSLFSKKDKLWYDFQNSIHEVIDLAVDLFFQEDEFPEFEDDLNRKFYFCLVESNYRLKKEKRGREAAPIYEGNNQPHSDDIIRAERENKRPDFQWSITDIYEPNPLLSNKQFVLECKRLGLSNGSWKLNSNYYNNGIYRFISSNHGYGKGAASGAMLAYVQSSNITDICSEVNDILGSENQEKLTITNNLNLKCKLVHKIVTESSSKIVLNHFWIELQDRYN
ncbi:MAG: hypothetical protein RIC35_15330 [Marinoscillum sp.]